MADIHDTYLTIHSQGEGVYKERGSKFLAKAWPVESEAQVRDLLALVRKEYYDASHRCFAWQLGHDQSNYRFSDDGEPAGSAGRPIHGQIQSAGITNVLVVVIRYFGGTKLGVRGLINAYRASAREAIENAGIISQIRTCIINVSFDYPEMNHVMKIVKDYELNIVEQKFETTCRLSLTVRLRSAPEVKVQLQRINGLALSMI